MFRRIKLLTLLQLSDRIKLKKSNSIKGTLAKIGIALFSMILITAICSALIYNILFTSNEYYFLYYWIIKNIVFRKR